MTDRMKPDHLGLPSDDGVVCTSLECWCWRTAHGFCAKKPKPQHMTPPASPESEPETFDALVERCAKAMADEDGCFWGTMRAADRDTYLWPARKVLQAAGVERLRDQVDGLEMARSSWQKRAEAAEKELSVAKESIKNWHDACNKACGRADAAESENERLRKVVEAADSLAENARLYYSDSGGDVRISSSLALYFGVRATLDTAQPNQESGQPASPPSAEPSDTAGPAVGAGCSSPIDPAEGRHRELLVALYELGRRREPWEREPATGESVGSFDRFVRDLTARVR